MPESSQRERKKSLLEKEPRIEDFHIARELFKQPQHCFSNKIKYSERFPFSAFLYREGNNEEVILTPQGCFVGDDNFSSDSSELSESSESSSKASKLSILMAYLMGKGFTRVKIAFRLLPNNKIQPMILKIITQDPTAHEHYKPRIAQEMKNNHFFGNTPFQLVIERKSNSNKFYLPKTVKSYLFLNDLGPDVFNALWGSSFSSLTSAADCHYKVLQVLDIAIKSLRIPYDNTERGYVHRDLKPENLALQPDEHYKRKFYLVKFIDCADIRGFSKSHYYLSSLDELSGTKGYLTPFLEKFSNIEKARWPLTILPPDFDVKKLHDFPPKDSSGFFLKKTTDGQLSLFIAGIRGKLNKPFSFSISLIPEEANKYLENNKNKFDFDTSTTQNFSISFKELQELLNMTKSFKWCLKFNLETELYAMSKAAENIINVPLPHLNNQSIRQIQIQTLLSEEMSHLVDSITELINSVLDSSTFNSCNPKPGFSEEHKRSLIAKLGKLEAIVHSMKERYLEENFIEDLVENKEKEISPVIRPQQLVEEIPNKLEVKLPPKTTAFAQRFFSAPELNRHNNKRSNDNRDIFDPRKEARIENYVPALC
jgi:serine/threonine protein kinase